VSYCVETGFDGPAIDLGTQNPGAQQARPHARNGDIERRDQRGGSAFAGVVGEDRRKQFQISHGDWIEDQGVVLLVVANSIEVAQRLDRGSTVVGGAVGSFLAFCSIFAEVVDDGA